MTTTDDMVTLRPAGYPPAVQRLVDWLHDRPGPRQLCLLLAAALVFQLAWSAVGVAVVAWIGSAPQQTPAIMRALLEGPWLDVMTKQALVVLIEEILFRLLPLGLALAIYRDNGRFSLVALFVVLSSVAFGLLHGQEWYRLALQAVGGLVLGIVYLKVSAMSGRYWLRALTATFLLHLAINTCILASLRAALGTAGAGTG